jgi:hypothetical protein
MEIYRNAKGRETDVLFNGTSVIRMIPDRAPKMRKERIISEFMMCLIRSTSIPSYSYIALRLKLGLNSQPVHSLQKCCV